ncbi:hypothetical protein D3C86_1593790 [compost metagenome]
MVEEVGHHDREGARGGLGGCGQHHADEVGDLMIIERAALEFRPDQTADEIRTFGARGPPRLDGEEGGFVQFLEGLEGRALRFGIIGHAAQHLEGLGGEGLEGGRVVVREAQDGVDDVNREHDAD